MFYVIVSQQPITFGFMRLAVSAFVIALSTTGSRKHQPLPGGNRAPRTHLPQ